MKLKGEGSYMVRVVYEAGGKMRELRATTVGGKFTRERLVAFTGILEKYHGSIKASLAFIQTSFHAYLQTS